MVYLINEVLNYGGFFAGDTVTVTARAAGGPAGEDTLTIDQGALTNLDDRFQILAGMALDVQQEGGHVVAAALIAAPDRTALRSIVKAKQPAHAVSAPDGAASAAARVFAHHCPQCNLWILGAPRDGRCGVEGHDLAVPG